MAKIMIDTDALTRCVGNLHGNISEYDTLNSQLQALTNSISASWTGASSEAFANIMLSYIAKALQMKSILEHYETYINQARQRFEELDQQCAAQIRGLF